MADPDKVFDYKRCTRCKLDMSLAEFNLDRSNKRDGRQQTCRPCQSAVNHNYRSQPTYRSEQAARHLRRRFGLSAEDYNALLDAQGGGCGICGTRTCDSGHSLAVDHDRRCCTGLNSCGECIRGILCRRCNTSLGKFGDDSRLLRAAVDYLERYEERLTRKATVGG